MGSFEDFMIDKTVKDEQRMADLKSEVERLKSELGKVNGFREDLRSKLNRKSDQLSEALHHLESVKRHHDEAQASAAVMRVCCEQALSQLGEGGSNKECDPSWIRPKGLNREQVNDRCIQAYHQIHEALSTTAGTAFLERMAEAEWLVKYSQPPPKTSSMVKLKDWITRADSFLKGEGVKA